MVSIVEVIDNDPKQASHKEDGDHEDKNESNGKNEGKKDDDENEQDSSSVDKEMTMTAIILRRLDPTLRLLLTVIQQYQNNEVRSKTHKLQLFQTQAELLQHLQQTLQSLNNDVSTACVLARTLDDDKILNYVSLPLLAILKGTTDLDWSNSSDDDDALRLRSAAWKCVAMAAQTWMQIMAILENNNLQPSSSLTLKALVALATALPSGQDILDGEPQQTTETTLISSSSKTCCLDRGEDCLLTLLKAIAQLLLLAVATSCTSSQTENSKVVPATAAQQTHRMNNSLAHDIAETLEGGLMARMADTCIAVLKIEPSSRNRALQLQAATTMSAMLPGVPLATVWQKAFPGCFAGMYQCLLRSLRATSISSRLPVATLQILVLLLRIALRQEPTAGNVSSSKETSVVVKSRLESLVERANQQKKQQVEEEEEQNDTNTTNYATDFDPTTATSSRDDSNEPRDDFFQQVRERLPAPLTILVNVLATSRSPAVRTEAALLYRVLLIDTRQVWETPSTTTELMTCVLESCLILAQDSDSDVSDAAKSVLNELSENKEDPSSRNGLEAAVSKITAVILELPSLAQRQREAELRAKLKLLSGYLTFCVTCKRISRNLRSAMISSSLSGEIQKALRTVFSVDLDGIDAGTPGSVVLVSGAGQRPQDPRMRYMNAETKNVAFQCLRKLGSVLSHKHAALYIDALIADIFKACVTRVEVQASFFGKSQVEWLHEWIGCIVIARELLLGSFAPCAEDEDTKSPRRRLRILTELTSSVLPIVSSSPLFDLPSVAPSFSDVSSASDRKLIPVGTRMDEIVSAALRGNAAVSFLLLDFIGVIFDLLNKESSRFLSGCLYPILEKASSRNIAWVRDMAVFTLGRLASACQYEDTKGLLLDNMDNLTSTILGRIRVPGGRTLSGRDVLDENVFLAAVTMTTLLRISADAENGAPRTSAGSSILSHGQELVRELTARFDQYVTRLTGDENKTMIFLQLFNSALLSLLSSYAVPGDSDAAILSESEPKVEPWLNLLEPFKKDSEDKLSPKEGFDLYRKQTEEKRDEDDDDFDRAALSRHIEFVAQLASRCCYLLSHPSLKVQIQSCDALIHAFTFLGWIATNVPENDEANGPTTAVLRQVHSSWTAIASRLKATSSAVRLSEDTSLLLVPTVQAPITSSASLNLGEQRVFLSKLFTLVAVMTECAGDFMANRFRDDVWPCIGQVIGTFVGYQRRDVLAGRQALLLENSAPVKEMRNLSESERGLLVSVLKCLAQVYGPRPAGLALADLIPAAGTMIFPFLEDEAAVASTCTTALQNMLRIDCDALWRPLLELSGLGIPPCPLFEPISKTETNSKEAGLQSGKLAIAAQSLVGFVESLPEQAFE